MPVTDNGEPRVLSERYVLKDRLGSGGMGTVWRATDQLLKRTVAAKEMRFEATGAEFATQAARARREAYTIARISHPNVVNVYDMVDEDEQLWLVMELVDGPSLKDRLDSQGPMDAAEVAGIGRQLLSALDAVHAADVVHRDVKPGNILVRPDGRAVLCDFGIAALDGGDSITTTGGVLGSVGFIAPERLDEEAAGPSSDLFSLGVTLCMLLSGRSPFARPEAIATLNAVIREEPDIPPEAGPLRPLLEALLRKNPADRPSAAEASEMLQTASSASAAAPAAQHPSADAPKSGAAKRGRIVLAALSTGLLLAVVAAAGVLLVNRPDGGADPAGAAGPASPSESPADGEAESPAEEQSAPAQDTPGPGEATESAAQPSSDSVPVPAGPTPTDAVLPVPGDPGVTNPGEYWMFSGDRYIRGFISATGYPVKERLTPASPIRKWDDTFKNLAGFQERIDAVLRVPGSGNEYWVFSGSEYARVGIATADQRFEDTLLQGPSPLSDWGDAFGDLAGEGVDAIMRTPDDPSQFWVFSGDRYIRTMLDGEGPGGTVNHGPEELSNWQTLSGFAASGGGVDAVMPVPDAPNDYWVFSGDRYLKIRVTDVAYEDSVLEGPGSLRNWSDLG